MDLFVRPVPPASASVGVPTIPSLFDHLVKDDLFFPVAKFCPKLSIVFLLEIVARGVDPVY